MASTGVERVLGLVSICRWVASVDTPLSTTLESSPLLMEGQGDKDVEVGDDGLEATSVSET